MKKSNSAQKSAETPAKAGIIITSDHRNESFEYWPRPTEIQLAELAARLARSEKIDPKQLVDEAWSIYWASCEKIKADYQDVEQRILEIENSYDDAALNGDQLPAPKGFPLTFQAMELLLLPRLKGRTAERAALFREYIYANLVGWNCAGLSRNPTPSYWNESAVVLDTMRAKCRNEVARVFSQWRSAKYDAQQYAAFSARFLRWYGEWSLLRRREAKSANAQKGWEKRRKSGKDKVAPRPKLAALKEILEKPQSGA